MDTNHVAKEQILQIVENQLKNNDPPETKQTYDRLLKSGITEEDTRIYIGQCEAVEIFDIMKYQRRSIKRDLLKI